MSSKLNRRKWIKNSALAAGAISISQSISARNTFTHAAQYSNAHNFWEWESDISKLPSVKARLLANENPYGPGPSSRKAIIDSVSQGNRYGHEDAAKLISLLAEKEGVTPDHIMIAPGSSDLLEKVAISRFIDGGKIISADPAYMSLIKTSQAMQAEWSAIPLTSTFAHDLPAMQSAIDDKTNLVYICNPNNPTGTITPGKDLWSFCSEASEKTLIFVDEAYLEFMDAKDKMSMVDLIKEGKNVMISRTFSKVYGMAGLRVGYVVAQPETLAPLKKIWRSNMGLNITALKGAIASLGDADFVKKSIEKNTMCREYVCAELDKLGFAYLPSQTSFVLFPIALNGKEFLNKMFAQGVGVRSFEVLGGTHCRVSMGTMEEMKLFVETLKTVLV